MQGDNSHACRERNLFLLMLEENSRIESWIVRYKEGYLTNQTFPNVEDMFIYKFWYPSQLWVLEAQITAQSNFLMSFQIHCHA